MAKTMLMGFERQPNNLWAEAVPTACVIRISVASKSCKSEGTSHEVAHKKKVNFKFLTLFVTTAFVHKESHQRDGKLSSRAQKEFLVRCCKNDAFQVRTIDIKKVEDSKDFAFDEKILDLTGDKTSGPIEYDLDKKIVLLDLDTCEAQPRERSGFEPLNNSNKSVATDMKDETDDENVPAADIYIQISSESLTYYPAPADHSVRNEVHEGATEHPDDLAAAEMAANSRVRERECSSAGQPPSWLRSTRPI